jgi:hypothetical protein
MFFVKTRQQSGKVVRTVITDENVFTDCPECGSELPVDLVELFADCECDFFSTRVYCASCSKNRRNKRHRFMNGMQITTEALALLADSLCDAGQGEFVKMVFDEFEIEELHELMPHQHEAFAKSLAELVADVL